MLSLSRVSPARADPDDTKLFPAGRALKGQNGTINHIKVKFHWTVAGRWPKDGCKTHKPARSYSATQVD